MMALDAMNDVSDDTLMVLYANGDQDAARMLTFRHAPRVLSLSKRLLWDATEAEDVAQEAMLRLWRIAPDWRNGEAKVSTWLYRVTSNLCTDRLRKKRGVALEDAPQSIDDAPSALETMTTAARADALQMAMNELPERQKLAVTLRHIDELSNPEIAQIMEISVEAVESLTARGKRTLAKLLLDQKENLGLE
ncbi:RNA polymerase sigma factor [Amylibacter sp. SFDW26]|uniref:RNA polymerase sigma factor n=1 Tax=Amylibacter sp. SFDW26 TaxID=2652722 RepID=UPI00186A7D83|nr:RNA polymerase sigma factor [Amylibacter sp. SFDW26]